MVGLVWLRLALNAGRDQVALPGFPNLATLRFNLRYAILIQIYAFQLEVFLKLESEICNIVNTQSRCWE